MSWQTQNWAGEQRDISPQAKLILIGMASCADANHRAYPSVGWLVEWSGLERKTVLKWLAAMSDTSDGREPLICDTGDRVGKSLQVKVWRLNVGADGDAEAKDAKNGTVPKTGASQKREHPKNSGRQSQKRDTEPFREPIPPSDPDGSEAPTAGNDQDGDGEQDTPPEPVPPPAEPKPHKLPADWTAPTLAELGDVSRRLAEQWPTGAYQAVEGQFVAHWQQAEGRTAKKSKWGAAWAKWVITEHDKIMRAAKAGTSFAAVAPPKASGSTAKPARPVSAKDREDDRSAGFHAVLSRSLGASTYRQWLKPAAILFEGGSIQIVVSTDFQRSYIETNLLPGIAVALARWNAPVTVTSEAKHPLPTERNEDHGQDRREA